jgi:hypothetical protein
LEVAHVCVLHTPADLYTALERIEDAARSVANQTVRA